MTILFKEERYFSRIWFCEGQEVVNGECANWMGALWRDPGESRWTFQYRFRYFAPGTDAFTDDRKSWYEGHLPGTEEEALALIEAVVQLISMRLDAKMQVVVVQDIGSVAMEKMSKEDWAHVQTTAPGGAA